MGKAQQPENIEYHGCNLTTIEWRSSGFSHSLELRMWILMCGLPVQVWNLWALSSGSKWEPALLPAPVSTSAPAGLPQLLIALVIRSGTFRITRPLIWCTEVGKGPVIRCWEQCSLPPFLFLGTLWTGEAVAVIMRHQQRQPVGFTKETCLDETCGRGGREWEGESRLGWNLGWKWIIMMQLIKVYHSQGPFVKWLLLPSLFLEPCDLSLCSDPFSH